ncbi:MAG: PQQ-binding-like beta-propeller repeat protein [Armatimonadetes bacterium]|nr:PQQ-binding-like beta-propeller repeat protein [Armatimonadota bacterium]
MDGSGKWQAICLGALLWSPVVRAQEAGATRRLILAPSQKGLNAYNLDDGSLAWRFCEPEMVMGGTPAVDQGAGVLYYQTRGRLWKANAADGKLIKAVTIPSKEPGDVHTTATVLADDAHGYHVICHYFASRAYGGSIRVYDADLNLIWKVEGLNTWLKAIPCYHDGVVYVGTGEAFQYPINHEWYRGRKEDARVIAYRITDGSVKWKCEVDPEAMYRPEANRSVDQVLYCNGYIIGASALGGGAEGSFAQLYVIDARTGALVRTYTHDARVGACGRSALSFGRLFRGDLTSKSTTVFRLGTGAKNDFTPYGVHLVNHSVAPDTSLQALDEKITFLGKVKGRVSTGAQGVIVHGGIVYACGSGTAGGVLAFDAETLAVVREYDTGPIWDSSPMIVEKANGQAVLVVLNHGIKKVRAYDVGTGAHLWDGEGVQDGYYLFGFSYDDRRGTGEGAARE